ncbi:MAG: demethoxyubiquinone hydroxylase family protein [Pseudomonadota bacterium]
MKGRPNVACLQNAWFVRELRSDHAGETGAVWIYRGILAVVRRDNVLREFCERHLATERRHLMDIERMLPVAEQSVLLRLWRVAGFLTGVLPALIGGQAVYVTIDAVERFVVAHYQQQVIALQEMGQTQMARTLSAFMEDEQAHQRDAFDAVVAHREGIMSGLIRSSVTRGSSLAVKLARWG